MLPSVFVSSPPKDNAAVSSAHPLASQMGQKVLAAGGNAIDAAIAVSSTLCVVEPYHSTLAGGGFAVVHLAEEDTSLALDFRGTAPQKASRDMFVSRGEVQQTETIQGYRSMLVPGLVHGLAHIHSRFGTKPWEQLWEPAIQLASEGIHMGAAYEAITQYALDNGRITSYEATKAIFTHDNQPLSHGLIQKDLALSMEAIQQYGPDVFYKGWIAEKILEELGNNGGIMEASDLADYRSNFHEPIAGTYREQTYVVPPLPCGGGLQVLQMLNILENFDLGSLGLNSAQNIELILRVLKIGYAHRLEYYGDPRYMEAPPQWLFSKEYAKEVISQWDRTDPMTGPESMGGTTHFTTADRWGNVVSWTQTVGEWYGSGVTIPGTGILMNDSMGDFAPLPGVANNHGYVYSEANAIAPGKSPLSSQTPIIMFRDGQPILACGAAGGPRIISTVLQIILNVVEHNLDIQSAINAPRIHSHDQTVLAETGISLDSINILKAKGWPMELIKGGVLASFAHGLTINEQGIKQAGNEPRLHGGMIF